MPLKCPLSATPNPANSPALKTSTYSTWWQSCISVDAGESESLLKRPEGTLSSGFFARNFSSYLSCYSKLIQGIGDQRGVAVLEILRVVSSLKTGNRTLPAITHIRCWNSYPKSTTWVSNFLIGDLPDQGEPPAPLYFLTLSSTISY